MADKANIQLVGCGGIGTISAVNLETGGRAKVTAILCSNYEVVRLRAFDIRSTGHEVVQYFKPITGTSSYIST